MEPYEGMRTVLAGFADLFAARPLLVALTLHEALGGWGTLPLPTGEEPPFPKLRDQVVGQLLDGMTGPPGPAD
jgi:hypothetical protein